MHEAGFIQAIREAPHDEAVRLIYADWLDERGDARGEFLRLESHLRTVDAQEPRRPADLARWLDLRDRVPADWVDGLGWRVNGLLLPPALVTLLAAGRWESASDLYLLGSPWGGVYAYSQGLIRAETSNVCRHLGWLGSADAAHPPGDVHPGLTVLIADQGIGSDQPFALDYRESFGEPRVVLYQWYARTSGARSGDDPGHRWVEVAPDFATFFRQLRSTLG
jgi:uncharacterized protein (TIGR02996 family)